MGSTSSKDHDSNPHDLGTYSPRRGNSGQYPLHHHPHYNQSRGHDSDHNMYGDQMSDQLGHELLDHDNLLEKDDAMEIDQSSSDLTTAIKQPPGVNTANDVVPMVFRWEHGGRNVYITGTFNGWSKQCPMHRSGNDFTYIANLTRGKHAYKFVVDEEWRFAPDQLTVADVEGNVNNFVDVSDFTPLSDFDFTESSKSDTSLYGRFIPDIDEYTKEPPPLPPHLRHIILNKVCKC